MVADHVNGEIAEFAVRSAGSSGGINSMLLSGFEVNLAAGLQTSNLQIHDDTVLILQPMEVLWQEMWLPILQTLHQVNMTRFLCLWRCCVKTQGSCPCLLFV